MGIYILPRGLPDADRRFVVRFQYVLDDAPRQGEINRFAMTDAHSALRFFQFSLYVHSAPAAEHLTLFNFVDNPHHLYRRCRRRAISSAAVKKKKHTGNGAPRESRPCHV